MSQRVLNPPRALNGMVSLAPLTHLLCWEGWLHPLGGQRGAPGLPSFSCGAEGRTQSGFGLRSSCHVYQMYFQCFYHPTPEQGHVAKISPQEMQKTILDPVPVHASTREGASHKAAPVHLENLLCTAGREAGFPIWQGSGSCATNPRLPPLAALGARSSKNEDPPAQGSQRWWTQFACTALGQAWLHIWARLEGNKALGKGSTGREQCLKQHTCRRGSHFPKGHPIPLLLTGDRHFCRETRLEHLPASGTTCRGGSVKTPPGGAAVPGLSVGGCSSCRTPSSGDAAT